MHTHTSEVGGGACARCCIHMSHELSNKYMFRVVFAMIVRDTQASDAAGDSNELLMAQRL